MHIFVSACLPIYILPRYLMPFHRLERPRQYRSLNAGIHARRVSWYLLAASSKHTHGSTYGVPLRLSVCGGRSSGRIDGWICSDDKRGDAKRDVRYIDFM